MEKDQRNEQNQEQRSSEQDMLRGQTMNETIRSVGNEGSGPNETLQDAEQGSGRSYDYGAEGSDMDRSGTGRQSSDHTSHQNLSSNTGGTVDMGPNSLTGSDRGTRAGTGSGLNTKRSVTGSDFDGQNKDI